VQAGEQLLEQVLAAGLVFRGGVVVLGLQGRSELDAGLEECAVGNVALVHSS
jgi:hypothetical protein